MGKIEIWKYKTLCFNWKKKIMKSQSKHCNDIWSYLYKDTPVCIDKE